MTKRWTQDAIIAGIKRWVEVKKSVPAPDDWQKAEGKKPREWPTASAVYREFGSWGAAISAAGFTARNQARQKTRKTTTRKKKTPKREWSKDSLIAAMREWAEEHGRPPASEEWRGRAVDGLPSPQTVKAHFGAWNTAIREAGFVPLPTGVTYRSVERYKPLPRRTQEGDLTPPS